jgi:hypothetical protein
LLVLASTVWLSLDTDQAAHDLSGAEQVLPQLEALLQFGRDLEQRLATVGVEGAAGILGLYRRLRAVLDGVPEGEIERRIAEAQALERGFAALAAQLREIQRLKGLVGR